MPIILKNDPNFQVTRCKLLICKALKIHRRCIETPPNVKKVTFPSRDREVAEMLWVDPFYFLETGLFGSAI